MKLISNKEELKTLVYFEDFEEYMIFHEIILKAINETNTYTF